MINDNIELFEMELREMHYIESHLIKVLRELRDTSSNLELKEAFAIHEKETREHAKRIEEVFGMLGMSTKENTSHALKGMVDDRKAIIKNKLSRDMKDLVNIAAAVKTEHMEIGAYENLINMANDLNLREAAYLLEQNMKEEINALKKLKDVPHRNVIANIRDMISHH